MPIMSTWFTPWFDQWTVMNPHTLSNLSFPPLWMNRELSRVFDKYKTKESFDKDKTKESKDKKKPQNSSSIVIFQYYSYFKHFKHKIVSSA